MIYRVTDNNKPATCEHFNVHKSWNNADFETLDQAFEYAVKWLGWGWVNVNDPQMNGFKLAMLHPYDYSGYGDMIQIVQINE